MKKLRTTPFDGYTVQQISTWCSVKLSYAKRLKKGTAHPSVQVQALFSQYSEHRVPGPAWKGWRFVGTSLWTPEDQEITQGDIRALPYLKQLHHELTRTKRGHRYENRSTGSTVLNFGSYARLRKQQLDKEQPDIHVQRAERDRE